LLGQPLVEVTGTLPVDFKVRGLEKRYLFKRAFRVGGERRADNSILSGISNGQ
jgi:hypothetical protein